MEHTSRSIHHEELLENLGWVQMLARRLVGDSAADDVGQDVWLKALERPPRARAGPELRAWLARVTRTLARQDSRTQTRRGDREQRAARAEAIPSTYDVLERGEAQRIVAESVMDLEEPERSTVLLRYLDGLSAVQIAERLAENPAAVRKRLSRALETLRVRLERRLGGRKELLGALLPLAAPQSASTNASRSVKPLAMPLLVVALASVALWINVRPQDSAHPERPAAIAALAASQETRETVRSEEGAGDGVASSVAGGGQLAVEASAALPNPGAVGGSPPPPEKGSLFAAVPESAFALLHVHDPSALRSRAERNDWVALCGSPDGEPALLALQREYEVATGTDFDDLVEVALELRGEALLFFTGEVAGFLTEPPPERAALAAVLDGWLADETRRAIEIVGGRVQLAAWPQVAGASSGPTDGGSGRRNGHFLAFLDHPRALGLYSGDSEQAVLDTLTASLGGLLGGERRAALVDGFLAAGGGTTGGLEAFVDFTPFVPMAEQALREAVDDFLPDPTGLLGLERGTSLFVSADVFPGTRVEVHGRLRIPEGSLAARLADSFEPLPRTLPPDLPRGTWTVWALGWNVSRFYATARAGIERAEADGLMVVDRGLAAAEELSGVDPIADVIDQLAGWFALYHVLDQGESPRRGELGFAFLAGLVDGYEFLDAFEGLIGAGGIGVDAIELEGAETYLAGSDGFMGGDAEDHAGADGGLSILPERLLGSLSRDTLVRGLRALGRVQGAGLEDGSELQAAFDENTGAFVFAYAQLSHIRTLALSMDANASLGENDPFESELIIAAKRTAGGFEARLYTR